MNDGKYLLLFASNQIVLGNNGAAIYCFDRSLLVLIPDSLYWVIKELESTPLDELRSEYGDQIELFDSYIDFLVNEDFAFKTDFPDCFPKKSLAFDVAETLLSATIRYSRDYAFKKVVSELNECDCKHLRVFLSKELSTGFGVSHILELTRSSTLRTIDIVVDADDTCDKTLIGRLSKAFPKFLSITACNSEENSCEFVAGVWLIRIIMRYEEFLRSPAIKNYVILDQKYFAESQNFNPYFNRKVFIDEYGEIKNGRDEQISFGNIKNANLADIVMLPEFQKRWAEIPSQLKNSEFRYCLYNPDYEMNVSTFRNCKNIRTSSF